MAAIWIARIVHFSKKWDTIMAGQTVELDGGAKIDTLDQLIDSENIKALDRSFTSGWQSEGNYPDSPLRSRVILDRDPDSGQPLIWLIAELENNTGEPEAGAGNVQLMYYGQDGEDHLYRGLGEPMSNEEVSALARYADVFASWKGGVCA